VSDVHARRRLKLVCLCRIVSARGNCRTEAVNLWKYDMSRLKKRRLWSKSQEEVNYEVDPERVGRWSCF